MECRPERSGGGGMERSGEGSGTGALGWRCGSGRLPRGRGGDRDLLSLGTACAGGAVCYGLRLEGRSSDVAAGSIFVVAVAGCRWCRPGGVRRTGRPTPAGVRRGRGQGGGCLQVALGCGGCAPAAQVGYQACFRGPKILFHMRRSRGEEINR